MRYSPITRIGPKELCRRRRLIISAKWQTVAFNCASAHTVCSEKICRQQFAGY